MLCCVLRLGFSLVLYKCLPSSFTNVNVMSLSERSAKANPPLIPRKNLFKEINSIRYFDKKFMIILDTSKESD